MGPGGGGTILSPPGDEGNGRTLTEAERALSDFTISLRAVWPVLVLSLVTGAVAAGSRSCCLT